MKDIAMTQILNPNDTGEIHLSAADTGVIPALSDMTEQLNRDAMPPLRSAAADQVMRVHEQPMLTQLRQPGLDDELMGLDTGGYPPVPKPTPPPKVAWNDRFQEHPTVRPARRGRHRAAGPRWARVVLGFGLYLLGIFTGVSAMVAWVVAQ